MKILVKGNIIGLGDISFMQLPMEGYFCFIDKNQKETDYDIVIRGDIEVDSIFFNDFVEPIYCTGRLIALGMSNKEIADYKNKKGE